MGIYERDQLLGAMKKPCNNCPFLKTAPKGWLGKKRATEIVQTVFTDSVFHCHKTLGYDDETGDSVITVNSQPCAGAALLAHKEGGHNRLYRLTVRDLVGADSVVDSAVDFVSLHT